MQIDSGFKYRGAVSSILSTIYKTGLEFELLLEKLIIKTKNKNDCQLTICF